VTYRLGLIGGALACLALAPAPALAVTGDDIIVVVAGTPNVQSSTGDNGPATSATLFRPRGVAADRFGNVYISQRSNSALRRVNANGVISLFAGTYSPGYNGDGIAASSALLNGPSAVATDNSGQVYIADEINGRVRKIDAFGTITSIASGLAGPLGVAVDSAGTVYVSDSGNNRVLRIAPGGGTSVFAGTGVAGYNGDGIPATSAQLTYPSGLATDAQGRVYIADSGRLRRVDPNGIIHTVAGSGIVGSAGDGGPASAAQVMPTGVAVDAPGNVYISEGIPSHRIRRIDGNGIITTIAGNGTAGTGGNGGPARQATLNTPFNLAVDSTGSLLIGDEGTSTVRRIINSPPASGGGATAGTGTPAVPPPPTVIVKSAPSPILSAVSFSWGKVKSSGTVITAVVARDVPAGAIVGLSCRGSGCPFKAKTVRGRRANVKLTAFFRQRRLRPGTVVDVQITAPGRIGKVSRITIRKTKAPLLQSLCLPPGATRPQRCG
jgi:NHL repeat